MAYTLDCSLADSGTSLCQVVVLGISAKKFHSRNREDDLGSVVTDDEQAFHLKKNHFFFQLRHAHSSYYVSFSSFKIGSHL